MSKIVVLDTIKKYLSYDPITGAFTWCIRPASNIREGLAGSVTGDGYLDIMFQGTSYRAARIAVYYMLGYLPERVDHINGDRLDNRWENLRVCTQMQNSWNRKKSSLNTSGVKGLSINAGYRYMCQVTKQGRTYLKYFPLDNKEEAIAWLQDTRNKLHGEFAHHG